MDLSICFGFPYIYVKWQIGEREGKEINFILEIRGRESEAFTSGNCSLTLGVEHGTVSFVISLLNVVFT